MRRAHVLVLAGVLALALAAAGGAFAGGPPVANETDHVVNGSDTFVDVDPCTGAPAQISVVQSGVMHTTALPDGTAHFTEATRGTFSLTHVDAQNNPVGPAYATGRFVDWDGGNGVFDENGDPIGHTEFAFTLNGSGTRTDGTAFRFHNNGHVVLDTGAVVQLEFLKAHCN